MYVQCLGSGDAFGSGGRLNSCFYIRCGDAGNTSGILLDCGFSASIAMKRAGIGVDFIDAIVVSHFHGDHFGGIPVFLREAQVVRQKERPLTIIGPEGKKEKVEQALQIFYPGPGVEESFPTSFLTYKLDSSLEFKSMKIMARKALHPTNTNPHCLRIEADKQVLAYSGDTEWTDDLISVSAEADLFICEASFLEGRQKNHLSVQQILEKLPLLSAKRIVLTHVGDDVLRQKDKLPLPLAEDGEILL